MEEKKDEHAPATIHESLSGIIELAQFVKEDIDQLAKDTLVHRHPHCVHIIKNKSNADIVEIMKERKKVDDFIQGQLIRRWDALMVKDAQLTMAQEKLDAKEKEYEKKYRAYEKKMHALHEKHQELKKKKKEIKYEKEYVMEMHQQCRFCGRIVCPFCKKRWHDGVLYKRNDEPEPGGKKKDKKKDKYAVATITPKE